jgi:hypothetical protein
MLLFLWAIFVFVIPNISPYAARAIYPIPPHSQIVRQEKLLVSDLNIKLRQRHEAAALEVIERKLSKKEAFQIAGQIESEWLKEKKQRLTNMDGDYLRKIQRQEQIAKEISSLSPYACFMYLVNGLANTDAESHERFLTQTARFDGEYFSTENKNNEKPRFHYEDAAVAERMKHSLPQLIILLLLNGLFLILGFVVFLRADVTK